MPYRTIEEDIRLKLEDLHYHLNCKYLNYLLKGEWSTAPLQGFKELYTVETIQNIDESFRKIKAHLISIYLEQEIESIKKEITKKRVEKRFDIEGHKVSFNKILLYLKKILDRNDRSFLWQLKISFVEKELLPLYKELFKTLFDKVKTFFPHYYDFLIYKYNLGFTSFISPFRNFLKQTEKAYTNWINKELYEKFGITLNSARLYDIDVLFRFWEFDSRFPSKKLEPFLKEMLLNLGIRLEELENLRLHIVRDRKLIGLHALCVPCKIPQEVYLLVFPNQGLKDFEALLYETGQALHYVYTSNDLSFEDKVLGDDAVVEFSGFVFQAALLDPNFLEFYFSFTGEELGGFIKKMMLYKLYLLRRYIARFLFEHYLYTTEDLEGSRWIYQKELEEALFLPVPDALYLYDIEPELLSIRFLRAWFGAILFLERARTRYGYRWFLSKEFGNELKEIWHSGRKFQLEEIIEFNPGVFAEVINSYLK